LDFFFAMAVLLLLLEKVWLTPFFAVVEMLLEKVS
jgi:hypothetical protein